MRVSTAVFIALAHGRVLSYVRNDIGAMFPGRVVLGVGTGESLNEVPATGMAWPGAKERRDRLREAVRLINKLWTEDRVTFEGQFYRTENATIYDKPKQKVPIWIAASGPLAAVMAGLRLPIESHLLQAFVTEPIKPFLDCVLSFGAELFYIS